MLWTASIVLLILCLIGFSIQVGWVLIHLFLLVAFGGAGHQPTERTPSGDLELPYRHFALVRYLLAALR